MSVKSRAKQLLGFVARKVLDYGYESGSGRGYASHGTATEGPLGSWATIASSPRDDIDKNLGKLRERSRDLYMSESLIASIIDTRVNGVVGAGLTLDAQIDAQALGLGDEEASVIERSIERGFRRWCTNAGYNGESFDEIARLVEQSILLSGDCAVEVLVNPELGQLRLRVIEGDLVSTPDQMSTDQNIMCGVQFSSTKREVGYWIANAYKYNTDGFEVTYRRYPLFMAGFQGVGDLWIAPKRGVLLVRSTAKRPGQVRGLPIVAGVMGNLKQLSRYKEAELDAAVVSAKAAMVITHPNVDTDAYADALADGDVDALQPMEPIALGNGTVVDLENGAQIQSFNPQRPNANAPAFIQEWERQICSGCGMPRGIATMSMDSSYNAARGELLQADVTYRVDRASLVRQLLRPIYNTWLDLNAQSLGLKDYYTSREARTAWRNAEWIGEQLPSLDPEKEINAATKRVALNVSTLARESQLFTGMDIVANIRQRGYEEQLLKQNKLVKDQNGNPIQEDDND